MFSVLMGSVHSRVAASLSLCSVYLLYIYIYRPHRLIKSNALSSSSLPGVAYLYFRCAYRAAARRAGCLYPARGANDVKYTVTDCRFKRPLLRSYCSVAGYGRDYPDSEFRDVPLGFPLVLSRKLLLLVLSDFGFRLRATGLRLLRQSVTTLQPVDELKKSPFTLEAAVLGYRQVEEGAEVDVRLSARSYRGCPVWDSILTLLSRKQHDGDGGVQQAETPRDGVVMGQGGEPHPPAGAVQVEFSVPPSVWFWSKFCLPGCSSAALWMLSVCLAEVEKHRGVAVVTAPVSVCVEFHDLVLWPGRVRVQFWDEGSSRLTFILQQPGGGGRMTGQIANTDVCGRQRDAGSAPTVSLG